MSAEAFASFTFRFDAISAARAFAWELLEDGIWRRLRETLHAAPNKLIFGKCENREKPTSEGAKRARKRPHQSGRQAAPCADANGD